MQEVYSLGASVVVVRSKLDGDRHVLVGELIGKQSGVLAFEPDKDISEKVAVRG